MNVFPWSLTIFLLLFSADSVSSANNTTQFENYNVEWEVFNILTCAQPLTLNVSSFSCVPRSVQQLNETSCLIETWIDFSVNVCQTSTSSLTIFTTVTNPSTQSTSTTSTPITTASTTTGSTTATATSITSTPTTTASTTSVTTITTTTVLTTTVSTSSSTIRTTVSTASTITITTTTETALTTISTTTRATLTTSTATTTASTTSSITTTATTTETVTGNRSTSTAKMTTYSTASTTYASNVFQANAYTCPGKTIGIHCNVSSDVCSLSQPCLNAATCFPNSSLPSGYSCQCQEGYTGHNCQNDERICKENTCWYNGTCVEVNATISGVDVSTFKCECEDGYTGSNCQFTVNLCSNISCANGGVCRTLNMKWKCYCLSDTLYYGDYCQFQSTTLKVKQAISKSFASVAITAITLTCSFVIIMDVLKYVFKIDPVRFERERIRQARREAKQSSETQVPNVVVRFQYIA